MALAHVTLRAMEEDWRVQLVDRWLESRRSAQEIERIGGPSADTVGRMKKAREDWEKKSDPTLLDSIRRDSWDKLSEVLDELEADPGEYERRTTTVVPSTSAGLTVRVKGYSGANYSLDEIVVEQAVPDPEALERAIAAAIRGAAQAGASTPE